MPSIEGVSEPGLHRFVPVRGEHLYPDFGDIGDGSMR
jgi:hypothetical protein